MHEHRQPSAWRFAWIYWAIVAACVVYVAATAPVTLAGRVYLLTLPWSVFSYGAPSAVLGWAVLGVGFGLNTLVLLYVGAALNQRRRS